MSMDGHTTLHSNVFRSFFAHTHTTQYRNMRSWSPPGQRGLEKRRSVDGFIYRGRFRIRDVSFYENEEATPSVASATSARSAPAVGRGSRPPPPPPPVGGGGRKKKEELSPTPLTSAAIAVAATAEAGRASSLERRSDVSDYSFCAGVSEVSENDDTGRLGATDGEGGRGRAGSSCRDSDISGGGAGGRGGRGAFTSPSAGEMSEKSGGYDSELGRKLLVRRQKKNLAARFRARQEVAGEET